MKGFERWVIENYSDKKNAKGDFARDLANDINFPKDVSKGKIVEYMEIVNAVDGAISACKELIDEYKEYRKIKNLET